MLLLLSASAALALPPVHALAADPLRERFKHPASPGTPSSPGAPSGPDTADAPPALQPGWDIEHYVLDVVLVPSSRTLTGTATITATRRIDDPGPLLLHADGPTVLSARVDGADVSWTIEGEEVWVDVPAPDDEIEVVVSWTGFKEDSGSGLQWGDPIHSFHEPSGARNWLLVHDVPADKATLDWRITLPDDRVVVANGEPTGVVDHGDGTATWTFEMADPLPPYLMVLHASPTYEVWDDPDSDFPVQIWARAGHLDDAVVDLGNTEEILAWMSDRWVPYPWTRYRNVLAPFGGGMEHTTATTMGEELIDGSGWAELINVHEAAHHWWGDLVTCQDWDDIWLNEGFASHAELAWYEAQFGEEGRVAYFDYQRDSYLQWHDWEGTFALHDPNFLWGGTVYDKGSLVLEMLRQLTGPETFDEILAEWATTRAHGTGTSAELLAVVEDVTGDDWGWYFDQWVYQAGDPAYTWGVHRRPLAEGGAQLDLWVVQSNEDGAWTMPLDVAVDLSDGSRETDTLWVDEAGAVLSLCVGDDVIADAVELDPGARVLYTDASRDDARFADAPLICGQPTEGGADTGDGPATPEGAAGFRGGPASCSAAPVLGGLWLLLPLVLRRRRA